MTLFVSAHSANNLYLVRFARATSVRSRDSLYRFKEGRRWRPSGTKALHPLRGNRVRRLAFGTPDAIGLAPCTTFAPVITSRWFFEEASALARLAQTTLM